MPGQGGRPCELFQREGGDGGQEGTVVERAPIYGRVEQKVMRIIKYILTVIWYVIHVIVVTIVNVVCERRILPFMPC